jgi:hypothetical protein
MARAIEPDMSELPIEQAIYASQGASGYHFVARSPGFRDDWLSEAQRLCTGLGERPTGIACPAAVFAQPFGKKHVAVVQVADLGTDDAGRPGALGFYLLVFARPVYTDWIGDPFVVVDRFPPPWIARGELPPLAWPGEPLPSRTVAEVQRVLKRPDSAALLGGAQALVDGGQLVLERSAPDTEFLRSLWTLLPYSTRGEVWPATFAFDPTLKFHALAVPRADPEKYAGYLTEEQAGDYPEGRYELNLQIAAESGSQAEIDALFARRSSSQMVRLCLVLVAVMTFLMLTMKLLSPPPPPPPPATPRASGPILPEPSECRKLSHAERKAVEHQLRELAAELGVQSVAMLTAEGLVTAIDEKLGTPPNRDCGPIRNIMPLERRVRALLWKHDIPEYQDRRYNVSELVERLQKKVVARKG